MNSLVARVRDALEARIREEGEVLDGRRGEGLPVFDLFAKTICCATCHLRPQYEANQGWSNENDPQTSMGWW